MFKVFVYDVVTTCREVEVPDACPACGANLRRHAGLRIWEYQDQARHATAGTAESSLDFDWTDLPEGGENTMELRWSCAACDHVLAEGREGSLDEDVTAPLLDRAEAERAAARPVEDGVHDPEQ